MKVKTVSRNTGDKAAREMVKMKKFSASPVISPEQKVIDKTVKKAEAIRKELKVLDEQLKLPFEQRTPELFRKYGKLISEEPVQDKIDLLGALNDEGLEKVIEAMDLPDEEVIPMSIKTEEVIPEVLKTEEEVLIPGETIGDDAPEYTPEDEEGWRKSKAPLRDKYNVLEREIFKRELAHRDDNISFNYAPYKSDELKPRPTLRDVVKKKKSHDERRIILDKDNYMIYAYHTGLGITKDDFIRTVREHNRDFLNSKITSIKESKELYEIIGYPKF